jgi:hypothetical protein
MTDWYAQFLAPDNFETAWQKIYRKGSSPGTDGETVHQVQAHINEILPKLIQSIRHNTYHPLPLKPLRELPTNNIPLAERSRSQQQAQPKSIIPPSCRSFRLRSTS